MAQSPLSECYSGYSNQKSQERGLCPRSFHLGLNLWDSQKKPSNTNFSTQPNSTTKIAVSSPSSPSCARPQVLDSPLPSLGAKASATTLQKFNLRSTGGLNAIVQTASI